MHAKTNHIFRYPKVLITVRSEQLSGHENYRDHFLPLESQNVDKDEQSEAIHYFQELRFIPFGDKREQYTSQVGEYIMPILTPIHNLNHFDLFS